MNRILPGVALILLGLLTWTGCKPQPRRSSSVLDDVQQTRSDLDQAYDMLARIDEFERAPATLNVIAYLSNYLAEQQADKDWQPDPLVGRLPRVLRQQQPVEQLASMETEPSDSLYMEEALLLRSIGNWVIERPAPPALAAWLKTQEMQLGPEGTHDLAAAYALFDWTIRNLQLDPLRAPPQDVVGATGQDLANVPAPLRGLPGPGYVGGPWHIAMTGHGDAWQRARLFILLARQQGIDVVMLAATDPNDENKTRPWACGVMLNEDLYLFDPAIGLPIPGPDGQGIATLAQVRDNPALLRALDVDNDHKYPITGEQVKSVTALIDASLEALSQRMQVLERGLAGDRQLKLAVQPSELATRLRKSPGVSNVAIWPVAIEAAMFEIALHHLPQFDPQLRQQIMQDRMLFEQRTWQTQARYQHLRGNFSSKAGERGAKELYLNARIPDAAIEAIDHDRQLQQQLGILGELERRPTPEDRQAFLDSIKAGFRRGKEDCSLWLGLAHYETGDYDQSVVWLDQRTLKAAPDTHWKPTAYYNLGRAYEALGYRELAQESYLAVESEATLGALLRAKRLQEKK